MQCLYGELWRQDAAKWNFFNNSSLNLKLCFLWPCAAGVGFFLIGPGQMLEPFFKPVRLSNAAVVALNLW